MYAPCSQSQVSEDVLLQLLERMFPEGKGQPKLTDDSQGRHRRQHGQRPVYRRKKSRRGLLWKARGYDPKKLEITKQKLGYALHQEDALGGLVVHAAGLKPLFTNYLGTIFAVSYFFQLFILLPKVEIFAW